MQASHRLTLILASLSAVALFFTTCQAAPATSDDLSQSTASLDTVDPSTVVVPRPLEGKRILQPEWIIEPQELDGTFVGPREHSGELEYLAIDSDGTVLWTARRPLTCSGFVLSRTETGQPIAVLTNVAATNEAIATTTVEAYDLRSGEPVWGPVPVTGPYKGPGLVYAAPPEEFIGDVGEKVALDPSTGDVLLAETDLAETDLAETNLADRRIVGEYHGTVITVGDSEIVAQRGTVAANETGHLWSIAGRDKGWDLAHLGNNTRHSWLGDDHALLATEKGAYAIVEMSTGKVLADDVIAAGHDPETRNVIAVDRTAVRAFDPEGNQRWKHESSSEFQLMGVGNGYVFLREGPDDLVLETANGGTAPGVLPESGDTPYIPLRPSHTGAAVVQSGQVRLLVTTEQAGN